MKLIKDYRAMKYVTFNNEPRDKKKTGVSGKAVTDPAAWIKRVALPARRDVMFEMTEEGIYKKTDLKNPEKGETYVTSLFFVQEPELGEGKNATELSTTLIDTLTRKFDCTVSDVFPALNEADSNVCYREFENKDPEKLKELRTIIGKHVFLKDGELVIE